MKLRELFVRIGVIADDDDLDKFEQKLDNAKQAVGDLAGWLTKLAAGFTAVTAGAGMFAAKTAEFSEEIVRNADALGMTTDKYQELHFSFKQLGASTDDMMDAMSTLTDRALDAAEGSKTYIDEFERLNIAVDDLRGKKPGQIFDMYVEAAQSAEDRTAAVASAVRLFGDDLGRRIMPALTTAADDFDEWREIARNTGIVMREDFVRAAREVRTEFRAMVARGKGLFFTVGEQLMPVFKLFIERINAVIDDLYAMRDPFRVVEIFAQKLANDLEKLWVTVTDLGEALGLRGAEDSIIAVYQAFKIFLALVTASKLMAALKAVAGLMTAASIKVLAVVAGFALLLAFVEDFVVYMRGGDSVIGDIVTRFKDSKGLLGAIADLVLLVKKLWTENKVEIKALLGFFWEISKLISIGMVKGLGMVLKAVVKLTSAVVHLFGGLAAALGALFQGELGKAAELAGQAFKKAFAFATSALMNMLIDVIETTSVMFVEAMAKLPGGEKLFGGSADKIKEWMDSARGGVEMMFPTMSDEEYENRTKYAEATGKKGQGFVDAFNNAPRGMLDRMGGDLALKPRPESSIRFEDGRVSTPIGSITIENVQIAEDLSKPETMRNFKRGLGDVLKQAIGASKGGEK
jgi:hypothetical protein